MGSRKQLGQILIDAGVITPRELAIALNKQKRWGSRLGSTLIRMGLVKEEDILRSLSSQLRYSGMNLQNVRISNDVLQKIPLEIIEKYRVIPVEIDRHSVTLAMSDPNNLDVVESIEFQLGVRVKPVVSTQMSIDRAIDRYYRGNGKTAEVDQERLANFAATDKTDAEMFWEQAEGAEEEEDDSALAGLDILTLMKLLIQDLIDKGTVDRNEFAAFLRQVVDESDFAS
jgi:type IV pilus assembly protein PilB